MQTLTEVCQELDRRFLSIHEVKAEIERLRLLVIDHERQGVDFACGKLGEEDGRRTYEMAARHFKPPSKPNDAATADADGPAGADVDAGGMPRADAGASAPVPVGNGAIQADGAPAPNAAGNGIVSVAADEAATSSAGSDLGGGKGFRPPKWRRKDRGRIEMLGVAILDKYEEVADALVLEALETARSGDPEQAKRYDRSYGRAVWKRMLYRAVFTEEFKGIVPTRAEAAGGRKGGDPGESDGVQEERDRDDEAREGDALGAGDAGVDAPESTMPPPSIESVIMEALNDFGPPRAAEDERPVPVEGDDVAVPDAFGAGGPAIAFVAATYDSVRTDARLPDDGGATGPAMAYDVATNGEAPADTPMTEAPFEDAHRREGFKRGVGDEWASHRATNGQGDDQGGRASNEATGPGEAPTVGSPMGEPSPEPFSEGGSGPGFEATPTERFEARAEGRRPRERADGEDPVVVTERIEWKGPDGEGARGPEMPVPHPGDVPETADSFQSGRIRPRGTGPAVVYAEGYLETFGP